MNDAVTETDLHAFIDDELPPARAAAVEAALAADPALASWEREMRADRDLLKAAFAPLETAQVPLNLLMAARGIAPRPAAGTWRSGGAGWRVTRRRGAFAAVGAAALAASLMLAILPRSGPTPAPIDQAMAARTGAGAAWRMFDGRDAATAEAASHAMTDMLRNPTRVPDLSRVGFALVSADIYGGAVPTAVQLRYQDVSRRLFTVFIRPSAGADLFEIAERGPVRLCVWQNADLTAVMTGEMPTPELFRIASLTYTSLGL